MPAHIRITPRRAFKKRASNPIRASIAENPLHGKPEAADPVREMKKAYQFIDLFAGIGGFRLGMENAGFQCVYSSEWDSFAQKTYAANFGDAPAGDIREILSADLPDFDILTAGFPCQPFSIAGVSKKKSLGRTHGFLDETQGTLFFDVARIIRDRRPRAFILENVKNLVSHDGGHTFHVILKTLTEELGYHVDYQVISSKSVVPQNRQRIFIVGFRDIQAREAFQFPESLVEESSMPTIGPLLEKRVDERYTLSDKLWNYLQDYREKHRSAGHGFGFGLVDKNGQTRTLSARYYKDGSEILVPQRNKNPRRLTPRECARLMGFPDTFVIPVSDTQAYKQFGNSVVVPVVEMVAKQLQMALASSSKDSDRIQPQAFARGKKKSSRRARATSTPAASGVAAAG